MLCSFTQTYSDNRKELSDFHDKDSSDINFRNKLDKNYYVFHNSSQRYTLDISQTDYFKKINNMEIISYNNMSYTQTLYNTLNKIKGDGFKYIFFLQDDVFSLVDDKILDELLEFVKNNSFDMLNIEHSNLNEDASIIYSNDNLKIYNTTSDDFKNKNYWAFDDGPFVANIDFLLNILYDDIFFSKNDIWGAETYLMEKVLKKKIQRLSTNISIFKRFNIVGPNAWNRNVDLTILNKQFK